MACFHWRNVNSGLPYALIVGNHMTNIILWIYIVLLVVGGYMGYAKAGSKVSLIMAGAFAALLAVCNLVPSLQFGRIGLADILLILLLVVFAMRLYKTGNFMPAGMMLVVTLTTLAARLVLYK
jgi:uncharacterized membrane protein (UPF0136 family)